MSYYGFTPQVANRGAGLAQAGAIIGQTVAGIPGEVRKGKEYKYQQEQRKKSENMLKKAAEDAMKEPGSLDTAYKTFKEFYKTKAAAAGIPEDEIKSDLMMIPMPRTADMQSVESIQKFLNGQSAVVGELKLNLI